jgi:hypothetical protein
LLFAALQTTKKGPLMSTNDKKVENDLPESAPRPDRDKSLPQVLAVSLLLGGGVGFNAQALAKLREETGADLRVRSRSPMIDGILQEAQAKAELKPPAPQPNYDRDGNRYDRSYDRTYDRQNEYDRVYDRGAQ